MSNNNNPGPELQVKINEAVSVKVNVNDVLSSAKDQVADAIKQAGKQLPNIPKMDLQEDSDDDNQFMQQYEDRKRDQRPLLSGQEPNNQSDNSKKGGQQSDIPLQDLKVAQKKDAKNNVDNSAPNPSLKKQQPQVLAPDQNNPSNLPAMSGKGIPMGEPVDNKDSDSEDENEPPIRQMYTPYSNRGGKQGGNGRGGRGGKPQQQYDDYYNEDDELWDDEIYAQMTTNQAKFYQLKYYACYFDVKTMDVMHRLRKAIWPFCTKSQLFEDEDKVDLYGPFWILLNHIQAREFKINQTSYLNIQAIMITLIVEIAIVGFIDYQIDVATLAIELKGGKIAANLLTVYSLQKVARAGFVCIAYFILNPLMLLLLIKYVLWVPDIQYLWLFAIYGYSFTIFIITTALNVVPIDWLKWVFLGISGLVSLFFIFSEMYALIKYKLEQGFCKFLFVCLFLTASHMIFIVALRKYFLT